MMQYINHTGSESTSSLPSHHGWNHLPSVHRRARPPPHHLPRRTRALRALCHLYLSILPEPVVRLPSLHLQTKNSPHPTQAASLLPSEPCSGYFMSLSCLTSIRMFSERSLRQAYPDDGSNVPVGCIVCKQSPHRETRNRGYIAMLSVHKNWRKRGIGRWSSDHTFASCSHKIAPATSLIRQSVEKMKQDGVQEVSRAISYQLLFNPELTVVRNCRLYLRPSTITRRH